MLYALGDPLSFVLLVGAFVGCALLTGWVSALACARAGIGEVRAEGRLRPDPRRQLDPFGAVGAAVAGFGWPRPIDPGLRRGASTALALLTGPLVVLALGLTALIGLSAVHGRLGGVSALFLQRGLSELDLGTRAWLLTGLMAVYVGALSLVPLPPLPGGAALFAVAPQSLGWQKAHYQLVERNLGTAVLLALLLIPLGGPTALLPTVLGSVVSPLVGLVSGG